MRKHTGSASVEGNSDAEAACGHRNTNTHSIAPNQQSITHQPADGDAPASRFFRPHTSSLVGRPEFSRAMDSHTLENDTVLGTGVSFSFRKGGVLKGNGKDGVLEATRRVAKDTSLASRCTLAGSKAKRRPFCSKAGECKLGLRPLPPSPSVSS